MGQSLSAAAQAAIENGQHSEGKGLWLLADACWMMLNPSSPNEPFKPYIVMNGKRSSLPEDFQQSDIILFSQFAEEVDNVWLQARLADLVWLLIVPRSPRHALLAIDAYRQIPLDTKTWLHGGEECWARAISLTKMLKSGAGERMKEIETAVITAFRGNNKINILLFVSPTFWQHITLGMSNACSSQRNLKLWHDSLIFKMVRINLETIITQQQNGSNYPVT